MRALNYIFLLSTLWVSLSHAANDPLGLAAISPNIPQIEAINLQTKLVQAFSSHRCDQIGALAPLEEVPRLPPLGRAIVAFCQRDVAESERLFVGAEALAPSSVAVRFLHARAVWLRDRAAAEPLWRKVEQLARDEAIRQVARDYYEGNARGDEMIQFESEWTYFIDARVGGGFETNPTWAPPSQPVIQTSPSLNTFLNTGLQRRFRGGSLAANYTFTGNFYSSAGSAQYLQQDLELPLNMRAGTNEDIRVRPFGSYWMWGGSPYYDYGGLAVQGIAYRGRFRQLVEGTVFVDGYHSAALQPQGGTHLHFDYSWEYYPLTWFARWLFYLEHVQAGRMIDPAVGSVPYSHNDFGLQSFLEWNLGFTLLGLTAKVILRQDDNDSRYRVGSASGPLTVKRRQDLQLLLQPSAAFPLGRGMYLIATYFFNRRFSNMGATDLVDYNLADQGAQVLLRMTLEAL